MDLIRAGDIIELHDKPHIVVDLARNNTTGILRLDCEDMDQHGKKSSYLYGTGHMAIGLYWSSWDYKGKPPHLVPTLFSMGQPPLVGPFQSLILSHVESNHMVLMSTYNQSTISRPFPLGYLGIYIQSVTPLGRE